MSTTPFNPLSLVGMQQPRLALIGEGSSARAIGQQVLVSVLEGSWGSWCSGSVLRCLWMIALCLEIRMQQTALDLDLK